MQAHKEFVPSRLVTTPFMTILRERTFKESTVENLPFRSNFYLLCRPSFICDTRFT